MRIEHSLSEKFLSPRTVRVLIVGVGGTGSAMLMGLPFLHQAMVVWGHPCGLAVTVIDIDKVSSTTVSGSPLQHRTSGRTRPLCW